MLLAFGEWDGLARDIMIAFVLCVLIAIAVAVLARRAHLATRERTVTRGQAIWSFVINGASTLFYLWSALMVFGDSFGWGFVFLSIGAWHMWPTYLARHKIRATRY